MRMWSYWQIAKILAQNITWTVILRLNTRQIFPSERTNSFHVDGTFCQAYSTNCLACSMSLSIGHALNILLFSSVAESTISHSENRRSVFGRSRCLSRQFATFHMLWIIETARQRVFGGRLMSTPRSWQWPKLTWKVSGRFLVWPVRTIVVSPSMPGRFPVVPYPHPADSP